MLHCAVECVRLYLRNRQTASRQTVLILYIFCRDLQKKEKGEFQKMDSRETVYKRPPNFCPDCVNKLAENVAYCSACGAPVSRAVIKPMTDIDDCIKKLSLKEQIAGIIWIVVGVFQIIIGAVGNFAFFLLGAVNIFTGVAYKYAKRKIIAQMFKNNYKNIFFILTIG